MIYENFNADMTLAPLLAPPKFLFPGGACEQGLGTIRSSVLDPEGSPKNWRETSEKRLEAVEPVLGFGDDI